MRQTRWLIIRVLIGMFTVVNGGPAHATIYYVDSNGSGTNSGTIDNPWLTQSAVSGVAAGDTVLYKCDSVFLETFTVVSGTSGNETLYSTYGTGEMPRFLGNTVPITGWATSGDQLTKTYVATVRSVFFGQLLGTKVSAVDSVDADLEWYHDGSTLTISNLADSDSITVATRNYAAEIDADSYVIVEGILFGKSHHANMYIKNTSHHITIRNNQFIQPAHDIGNADATSSVLVSSSCYDLLIENNTVGDSTGVESRDRRMAAHCAFRINGSARTVLQNNTVYYSQFGLDDFYCFLYDSAIRVAGNEGDSILVKNNIIRKPGSSGIFLSGTYKNGSYTNVSGNTITDPGQAGINPYTTRYAVGADTTQVSIIANNYVSGCNRTAGHLGSGSGTYPGTAGVDHSGNEACGIHLNDGSKGGVDPTKPFVLWIVEHNEVTGGNSRKSESEIYTISGQDGGGVAIDYNAHRAIVRWNYIHDNEGPGMYGFNATRCTVYGNLFYRNDKGLSISALSAGTEGPADDWVVYNNTFADNWNEGDLGNGDGAFNMELWIAYYVQDINVFNNIFYASPDTTNTTTIRIDGTNQSNITINNNLYYRDSGTSYWYFSSGYKTWSNWQTAGYDANGTNADPSFNDAGSDDFSIAYGSAATGIGSASYNPLYDITGTSTNSPPDAGAYTVDSSPAALGPIADIVPLRLRSWSTPAWGNKDWITRAWGY